MDVELAVDRPAGNFRLILHDDLFFLQVGAAAGRTMLWKARFVFFVDRLRRWGFPMGMSPVVLSRLSARLLRVWLGTLRLAEGRSLPLSFTTGLLQQRLQLRHLLLKFANGRLELANGRLTLFVACPGLLELRPQFQDLRLSFYQAHTQLLVLGTRTFLFSLHDRHRLVSCPLICL